MATIQEQMNTLNDEISVLVPKIIAEKRSASEWLAQSQVGCDQTLKSKREACQADKAWKANNAAAASARAKALEDMVAIKNGQVELLRQQQISQNKATVTLAEQGKSNEALLIEAEGKAKAAQKAAELESTAKASATTTEAQSAATMKVAIIGVITVAVVIALILFIRKMKKPA